MTDESTKQPFKAKGRPAKSKDIKWDLVPAHIKSFTEKKQIVMLYAQDLLWKLTPIDLVEQSVCNVFGYLEPSDARDLVRQAVESLQASFDRRDNQAKAAYLELLTIAGLRMAAKKEDSRGYAQLLGVLRDVYNIMPQTGHNLGNPNVTFEAIFGAKLIAAKKEENE